MKKYDNYNTDPYSMHMRITKLIPGQKKVLDVGCAYGNLAEVMSTNECEVVGVEIDPEAGKNAQKYCKEVVIGDVESIELSSKYFAFLFASNISLFSSFVIFPSYIASPMIIINSLSCLVNEYSANPGTLMCPKYSISISPIPFFVVSGINNF